MSPLTENPVVVVASIDTESGEVLADLTRIRDDVRAMLERQLELGGFGAIAGPGELARHPLDSYLERQLGRDDT